jgi:hypothetical protein
MQSILEVNSYGYVSSDDCVNAYIYTVGAARKKKHHYELRETYNEKYVLVYQ